MAIKKVLTTSYKLLITLLLCSSVALSLCAPLIFAQKDLPRLEAPGFNIDLNPGKTVETIFSNLLGVFTLVGAMMFIVYFVLGALKWISASGKAEQIQQAKDQMINAALGLIVVVLAYGIIHIVGSILGIDILNPARVIPGLNPQGQPAQRGY